MACKNSAKSRGKSKSRQSSWPQGCHKVATGCHGSISDLRHLDGLKKAREFVGISLDQVADMFKVSRGQVCAWQAGTRRMPREFIVGIGKLIAQRITDRLGREIGVKITVNSPWNVTPWAQCRHCRVWFELHRSTDRLCPDCRRTQCTKKSKTERRK